VLRLSFSAALFSPGGPSGHVSRILCFPVLVFFLLFRPFLATHHLRPSPFRRNDYGTLRLPGAVTTSPFSLCHLFVPSTGFSALCLVLFPHPAVGVQNGCSPCQSPLPPFKGPQPPKTIRRSAFFFQPLNFYFFSLTAESATCLGSSFLV